MCAIPPSITEDHAHYEWLSELDTISKAEIPIHLDVIPPIRSNANSTASSIGPYVAYCRFAVMSRFGLCISRLAISIESEVTHPLHPRLVKDTTSVPPKHISIMHIHIGTAHHV